MYKKIVEYLSGQFERGRPILVSGAGFSSYAKNLKGEPVPSGPKLAEKIWGLVYPDVEYEEKTQLQDIFEIAKAQCRTSLISLLNEHLIIDPSKSDLSAYEKIFLFPWYRSYTLNADNLDKVLNTHYMFRRKLLAIDGMAEKSISTDSIGSIADNLFSIHLNGIFERDPDAITFGRLQYARRTRFADPWYSTFTTEIMTHSVVFIGTTLDEPPLWEHIEQRDIKGGRGVRENRPWSFLITRDLSKPRADLLKQYNVEWLNLELEEFYEEILSKCKGAVASGYKALRALSQEERQTMETDSKLYTVETLLDKEHKEIEGTASDFLLGSEPTWNDIRCGAASKRHCDNDLFKKVKEIKKQRKHHVLILTGTAGSGKSTVAKRIALELHKQGENIGWIDQYHCPHSRIIINALESETAPDILLIEDAFVYGQSLESLLIALKKFDKKIVIVVLRSNQIEKLLGDIKSDKTFEEFVVPNLSDEDIDGLLDSLDRFNRLGILKGKSRDEQRNMFKSKCNRQLLVAMIEATSGADFDKKCTSEYEQLSDAEKRYYEIAVVATCKGIAISQDDLILSTGQQSNPHIDFLRKMLSRGLLLYGDNNTIRVRHKVISEKVFDHMVKQNLTVIPITALLYSLCSKTNLNLPKNARPKRNIVALLNHEFLYKACGKDGTSRVYGQLETILRDDYHYWLQRGSFHLENGDVLLAENFINQAYSMEPLDKFVVVSKCYLQLKKAYTFPTRDDSGAMAKEAIENLVELINSGESPYYTHILGSQGLAWSRKGRLSFEERVKLLALLREKVSNGVKLFPRSPEIKQLNLDIEKEYLMVGSGANKR